MTRAYLTIRDIEPDSDGRPALPAGWDVSPVDTTPAPTWTARKGRRELLIVRCNAIGARALYMLRGADLFLASLPLSEAMPARRLWRLAQAGPGPARAAARAWRWWVCDVTERATQEDVDAGEAASVGDPIQRDGVRRELLSEGVTLPAPSGFPWNLDADGNPTTAQLATIRVRALIRPALTPGGVRWTMAGHGDSTAFEDEPDDTP